MNTYEIYLENAGPSALTIEDALEIFNEMVASVKACKIEDKMEFYDEMIQKACAYAKIRDDWEYMTREEKQEADQGRTIKHNAFIDSLDILNRLITNDGVNSNWREKLGEERKRIGDYACFVSYITGICNR